MSLALLTTFTAGRKEPLVAMMDRAFVPEIEGVTRPSDKPEN
jgi:hypothetical protein